MCYKKQISNKTDDFKRVNRSRRTGRQVYAVTYQPTEELPLLHGSVCMDSKKTLCHRIKSHRQCAHVACLVSEERHMSAVVGVCVSVCAVVPSAVQPQAQRSPLGSLSVIQVKHNSERGGRD